MMCCEHIRHHTQGHECIEKLKFVQIAKNGSESTHPGVVDPFPQGAGLAPGFRSTS
jgi:hypothetical protein